MYLARHMVVPPDTTLEDRGLVKLPVVGSQLANNPVMSIRFCSRITTDAPGVYVVALQKPYLGAGMLGDVTVSLETRNCIT